MEPRKPWLTPVPSLRGSGHKPYRAGAYQRVFESGASHAVDISSETKTLPGSRPNSHEEMTNPAMARSAQQRPSQHEIDNINAAGIPSNQLSSSKLPTNRIPRGSVPSQQQVAQLDTIASTGSAGAVSSASELPFSNLHEIPLALRKRSLASLEDEYADPKRPKVHPRAASLAQISPQRLPLTVDVSRDYQERYAFHFFKSRTVRDILGQQDAHLWDRLFLQASHEEPVIKHAVIAVASLHKSIEFDAENNSVVNIEGDRKMRAFSLQHYLKAVRLLTTSKSASNMSPEVMLTVCILFVCFEEFRGDFTASLVHLKGGIELLRQWRQCHKGRPEKFDKSLGVLLDRLDSILTRLDVQEATFMDSDPDRIKLLQSCHEQDRPTISNTFESLLQARESLDQVMKWMFFRLENTAHTERLSAETEIEGLLNNWLRALKPYFVEKKREVDPSELPAICLLRIYYLISTIIYRTFYSEDEMAWDLYTEQFKTIVDLARKVLLADNSLKSPYKLIFSFDFGITPPLSLTTVRCRDPTIRRQALTLLRNTRNKQGPFGSSGLVAKCEEYIMQVEEKGLGSIKSCADVPSIRRVRKMGANVETEKGTIKLQYIHYPYDQKAERSTAYLSAID